ncbi:OPT-domain-containing protein [Mycena vulgaris]|nr:OPT-domain-containing protein [Mycena vulgaris]
MKKNDRVVDKLRSRARVNEKGTTGLAYIDLLSAQMQAVPEHLLEAAEHAQTMSTEEIKEIILRIVEEHEDDPNFPPAVVAAAKHYLYDENLKQNTVEFQHLYEELKVEAALILINSPYAEVRAVVDNHDDPRISGATIRTFVIGTIFVGTGGFINQFFSIRFPAITITTSVAQVLAFPAAKLMEFLPTTQFTTFGYTWSLNPGKFNPKEHMLITIMANAGFNTPYISNIIWIQYLPLYFNQSWAQAFGYQIAITLSTNFIGYGLAGLVRRFLVYPAYAIWPYSLAVITFNRAFHAEKRTVVNGWKMSKMRWFLYCFCSMFVYFWFPDFIFQASTNLAEALSYFNWMTWAAPNNVNLAAVTGSITGLGLNPIPTFDWAQFTVYVDPLIYPFFSTFNAIILALWYTNTWNTGYLPINANQVFDNTGNRYNMSNVVGGNTFFNQVLYENYSPAYFSAGNILIYVAVYTATLTHTMLYHGGEIVHGFKSIFSRRKTSEDHKDIHVHLMMAYKEVPEWQYLLVLVIAIAIGAAGINFYPTETSPAVVLYGVFLAMIFVIPIGSILAVTNVQITLNVLAELFGAKDIPPLSPPLSPISFSYISGGLWFPGNVVAMNYFKAYGYVTTAQTLNFAGDLKLAHYMHIPPVHTFWAQIYATMASSFVCIAMLNFQMTKIADVCTPEQVDHFTCPGVNEFFTASVLWGTPGPKRMFGADVLPIPFFFLRKRFKVFEYIHLPVLLTGGLIWAPYNLANIWPAIPVAYLFNVYIKKRYIAWWCKYNYITTTAFSSAIAISGVVIFFAVQWFKVQIVWSGNTRPFQGCDGAGCTRLAIPDSGFFGPGPGEFH